MPYFKTLIVLSFMMGFTLRHYQLFPYPLIKATKEYFFHQEKKQAPKHAFNNHYHNRVSFFSTFDNRNVDVTFLGDSLTENANWQEIFPDIKIANRGISDDTTYGILNRLDTALPKTSKQIFIMIGINDFRQGLSFEETANNYKKIISHLAKKNVVTYVQSTLLTNNKTQRHMEYNPKIMELNSTLEQYCLKHKNIHYLNLINSISTNNQLNPKFSNDGIHLNGSGYLAWAQSVDSLLFRKKQPNNKVVF